MYNVGPTCTHRFTQEGCLSLRKNSNGYKVFLLQHELVLIANIFFMGVKQNNNILTQQ